jgi:hypothetical protein
MATARESSVTEPSACDVENPLLPKAVGKPTVKRARNQMGLQP